MTKEHECYSLGTSSHLSESAMDTSLGYKVDANTTKPRCARPFLTQAQLVPS